MFTGNIHDGNDVAVSSGLSIDHLFQTRRFRHHQVIGQQDGKRFVTNQVTRAPDRVSKPQRFLLPCKRDLAGLEHRPTNTKGFLRLATLLQEILKFEVVVEMVLDRGLAPAGNKDKFLDTGGMGFFNRVLNQWFIDDRQHFLRHGLGCRQKPGSHAADGKHRLAYLSCHCQPLRRYLGSRAPI